VVGCVFGDVISEFLFSLFLLFLSALLMELDGRSSAHGKSFLRDQWSTPTFVTNYMPVIIFPVLYGVVKVITRISIVKLSEMDFVSGIAEVEAITWIFFVFVLS